jgi:Peptidase family M23
MSPLFRARRLEPRSFSRRRHRSAALLVPVLVGAMLALSAPALAAAPQFAPVGVSVLAPPQPVKATDGRVHLVYELTLVSVAAAPVEVQALDVRAAGGRSLLKLAGAELVMTAGAPLQLTKSLAPGAFGTVWLDVALARGARVPRALVHRLRVQADYPAPLGPLTFTFKTARTRVSPRAAVLISPPLRGGPFLNFNGCCGFGPHRAGRPAIDGGLQIPQRFATDYIRIDRRGNAFTGDVARNESFFGFREPVYAIADGRVVSTRNDLPENTPPVEPPSETFTPDTNRGNSIVLKLGDGRYALYGHLHTGSIRVRPGQRVRAGKMLARLGNTGASGAPHLHLDISDSPKALAGNGMPYMFDRFRMIGTVTNLDEFLTATAPATVRPLRRAARRHQYPLQASVLRFPG